MKFISNAVSLTNGSKLAMQFVLMKGCGYLYATDSEPSLDYLILSLQTPYDQEPTSTIAFQNANLPDDESYLNLSRHLCKKAKIVLMTSFHFSFDESSLLMLECEKKMAEFIESVLSKQ